ncbi:hypothetical protein NDU88_001829 [Pleurodeles waltl]|uniref:Uncharacterized protein n=1 Tax=Pleurodeles waltl TaxID=8319 RepID=A0AAV7W2P4_PLEWA|nr:hypothetical protein NDU88_001829 [Pleurodeles waltl]
MTHRLYVLAQESSIMRGGPPQVPLYASATFSVKAGISSGCAHQPPFLSDSITPVGVRASLSGDPPTKWKETVRGRAGEGPSPASPPSAPHLGRRSSARFSPQQAPGSSGSDRHAPDPAGKAPGQHPRVTGPPGAPVFLRDPDHRVGFVAVGLHSVPWPVPSIYLRTRASQRARRHNDPSSGQVPPGPPRTLTGGATVLSPQFHGVGTSLGATPMCRHDLQRPPRRLSRHLSLRPLLPPPGVRRHPRAMPLISGLHNTEGVAEGQSRSTGGAVSSVVCVSPVAAVAVRHLGPAAFICGLTACRLVGRPARVFPSSARQQDLGGPFKMIRDCVFC